MNNIDMKEVICPQCHTAFTIDENNYAGEVPPGKR